MAGLWAKRWIFSLRNFFHCHLCNKHQNTARSTKLTGGKDVFSTWFFIHFERVPLCSCLQKAQKERYVCSEGCNYTTLPLKTVTPGILLFRNMHRIWIKFVKPVTHIWEWVESINITEDWFHRASLYVCSKSIIFGGGEKKLLLAFTDIKSAVKMKTKSFSAHRQE